MILLAALAMAALPPANGPEAKLDRHVLDAINDCGPKTPGEIDVCGKLPGHDSYRPGVAGAAATVPIPRDERIRYSAEERERLTDPSHIGTGSCSAAGAGGWTGCGVGGPP